ncbi:SWIM zinc finger family protein [Phytomonospora endophytica]|uniref:Putative Zn finger protein n=1 Tax=Phytomonospora endophytica TaxID=714109 RepID=A0A841FL01_9ACTN|nr:hypothetical protein [Phytomonospora endophytica]MBB6034232.1 putative Zn finger protein [Phytomonospora endophytica]GIG66625.1 hypothetical protein Pen01_29200 [Phytomonospora endophytica]
MSTQKTWWGKRWPRTLEALGLSYPDSRIVRARALIRSGAVDDLLVEPGSITAWIDQPGRAYGVTIRIPPLGEAQWTVAAGALAGRTRSLADLLDDRLPEDVDRVLATVGLSLFPRDGELSIECPCSARGLCVHVITVSHAFADRFDDDPFLLPFLRGGDRARLLSDVRAAMSSIAPPPPPAPVGVAAGSLSAKGFYAVEDARDALTAWAG